MKINYESRFAEDYSGRVVSLGESRIYTRDSIVENPMVGISEHGSLLRLTLAQPGVSPALSALVLQAAKDVPSLSMVMPVANLRIWQSLAADGKLDYCSAAVIDWDPFNGTAHAIQAGPVSVWLHSNGRWLPMFEKEFISDSADHPIMTKSDLSLYDYSLNLNERHQWLSSPVGRFEKSITRNSSAFNIESIAMFTSDVQPLEQVFPNPSSWFSSAEHSSTSGLLAM